MKLSEWKMWATDDLFTFKTLYLVTVFIEVISRGYSVQDAMSHYQQATGCGSFYS